MRYLFLTLALVGCVSPGQVAVKQTEHAMRQYGPACEKLGYQPQTDPWRECILKMSSSTY